MTRDESTPQSPLRDEESLRWGFLDEEQEACAVVSQRMELVYINAAGQKLVPPEWFGKRCFEVLPHVNEQCAWRCPTIKAVAESPGVAYCEERIRTRAGNALTLGVAVIPVSPTGNDPAKAILLFRARAAETDRETFERVLVEDGTRMSRRIASELA